MPTSDSYDATVHNLVTSPAILLVEDHADTIKAMARLLRKNGYTVTEATTKAAALQLCEQGSYDILISDLSLPDGSGLELMEELSKTCKTPGIALTGHTFEADIDRTRAAGFAAHLTKPVLFDDLLKTIDELLAGKFGKVAI